MSPSNSSKEVHSYCTVTDVERLAEMIAQTHKRGGKVLVCGNGGLAAESEHAAAELVGQYGAPVYIPCLALTANSSILTALANDMGFENVFAHQVVVWGQEGDLLIAMTTSQSPNIKRAISAANAKGMQVALICSQYSAIHGGYRLCGTDTAMVQNRAIEFLHAAIAEAKRRLLGPTHS